MEEEGRKSKRQRVEVTFDAAAAEARCEGPLCVCVCVQNGSTLLVSTLRLRLRACSRTACHCVAAKRAHCSTLLDHAPWRWSHHGCRRKQIDGERRQLPAWSARAKLLQLLQEHRTLVVVGETGSGKTTQIPQFLLHAKFGPLTQQSAAANGDDAAAPSSSHSQEANGRSNGSRRATMVAVTQPRRVAAMTVARRVAEEMGTKLGDKVRGEQLSWEAGGGTPPRGGGQRSEAGQAEAPAGQRGCGRSVPCLFPMLQRLPPPPLHLTHT